jgi:hypothetical protein
MQSASSKPDKLYRYTGLPSLVDILSERRITLLSPKTWDDKNDAFTVLKYKEQKALKTVLALCFSTVNETYHHWRVFSSGSSGVCIVFDKEKLLEPLQGEGFSSGTVKYRTLKQVETQGPQVEELPFWKRAGFKYEKEFRIIFESEDESKESHTMPIHLDSIVRVFLSPWLPEVLEGELVSLLREIKGCSGIKISRSTLIENERWKNAIKRQFASEGEFDDPEYPESESSDI